MLCVGARTHRPPLTLTETLVRWAARWSAWRRAVPDGCRAHGCAAAKIVLVLTGHARPERRRLVADGSSPRPSAPWRCGTGRARAPAEASYAPWRLGGRSGEHG